MEWLLPEILAGGFVGLLVIGITLRAFPSSDGLLLGVVTGGLSGFLAADLLQWVHHRLRFRKYLDQPCVHGTLGGWVRRQCDQCNQVRRRSEQRTADRRKKEMEEAHQEASRLNLQAELKRRAEQVRESEIARLRRAASLRYERFLDAEPQEFEDLIANLFRALGHTVKQTPYSGDAGFDARAWKDGKLFLLECKRYSSSTPVGRRDLQVFRAAIQDEGAVRGFLISTGRLTPQAASYLVGKPIELIDRQKLRRLINDTLGAVPDDHYAGICLSCGKTNELSLSSESSTICKCGASVHPSLTYHFGGIHRLPI